LFTGGIDLKDVSNVKLRVSEHQEFGPDSEFDTVAAHLQAMGVLGTPASDSQSRAGGQGTDVRVETPELPP